MKTRIILIAVLAFVFESNAQQEYQYSQFEDVKSHYNPAATGISGYSKLTGIFKKQWTGVVGSPQSGLFSYEMPIGETNMSAGLYVLNDQIGVTNNSNIAANYAYKVRMGDSYLSFGLNAGVDYYYANLTELDFWDYDDQVFANNISGKLIPHFGTGVYFMKDKFYAGLSIPRLINVNSENIMNLNLETSPVLVRHYYLTSGYEMDVSQRVTFSPATLIRYTANTPLQADIIMKFTYDKMFSLGASYRTLGAVCVIAQFNFMEQLKVGYSIDFATSKIRSFSNGTHEIMISYEFGKRKKVSNSSI